MLDLDKLIRPAGRAEFVRDVRILKARDEAIVRRLASPTEERDIEFERPLVAPEITNGRPVRWVVRRTTAKWTGYFYSAKNGADGEMIPWESFNEQRAMTLLECDPTVTAFLTQPFTLQYPWPTGYRRYTPDLLVWRRRQAHVIEVKWSDRISAPEFKLRWRLFAEYFAARDIRYDVWTEKDIGHQPRLCNAEFLIRYRGRAVPAAVEIEIRDSLRRRSVAPIRDLAAAAGGTDPVYSLLLRGVLAADLDRMPLTDATEVRLAGEVVS